MTGLDYVRIGQIINTHGNHGELKIKAVTDFLTERFAPDKKVWIKMPDQYLPFTVEKIRSQRQFWLLKLVEINDLNQAQIYKNCGIYADTSSMPELEPGQYFYKDIMGITVQDQKRGVLGQVVDIMNLGPNDVWTIRDHQGKEILIPILKSTLIAVDLPNHVATVALPEGLIDEN